MKVTSHVLAMFAMFGPYHIARLNALARECEVIGIEGSSCSTTYAWRNTIGDESFRRLTLFNSESIETKSGAEIEKRLFEVLNNIQPSVVAVPGWSSPWSFSMIRWSIQRRIPVVMMSATKSDDARRHVLKEKIKRFIVGVSSSALVGGAEHASYLARLGIPIGNIFVGYNVVDNEYFSKKAEDVRKSKKLYRTRYSLPDRFILGSTRFLPRKNIGALIAAYAQATLNVEAPPHLILLGHGIEYGTIKKVIAQHNLEGRIHLPGFCQYDELPIFYALAEGFVHVPLQEQWGLVVNEAMASGLPVVVSRTCGAAELVKDGLNGFLVDAYNLADIRSAVSALVTLTQEQRARMGAAGRDTIQAWGPERFSEGLLRAAEVAVSTPMPRAGMSHRALLSLLTRRWSGNEAVDV